MTPATQMPMPMQSGMNPMMGMNQMPMMGMNPMMGSMMPMPMMGGMNPMMMGADGVVGEVHALAGDLSGDRDMQRIVDVVVPLGLVEPRPPVGIARQQRGAIVVILQDEVDGTIAEMAGDRAGDLDQYVLIALVADRLHGVEPQAVEMILFEPVERVVDEEVAHRTAGEVDADAPWRVMALGEEVRRGRPEIVPLGAEVIVDDVEEHHQPARMRGRDQGLELVRRTVARFRREQADAVIAPIVRARRLGERHQLDRRDTQRHEMVQLLRHRGVSPLRRERSDMQLVDHGLFPGAAAPVRVGPAKRRGINDLAVAVHILGLPARGRIGNPGLAVEHEGIAVAGTRDRADRREPAVALGSHRQLLAALAGR
jgi:hypothetical protein